VDLSKELKYDYTYRPPDHVKSKASDGPIKDVLSQGEKVLWSGQPPRKLLVFRMSDLFLLPFALFWTGFSIVWELGALAAVMGSGFDVFTLFFPLFGVPFLLIGFYMLFGRFIMDVVTRRRTFYALTDRRALVLTALRDRNVVSTPLHKIDHVDITLHRDGHGTLTFQGDGDRNTGSRRTYYAAGTVMSNGGGQVFDHIENPKAVYDMVLKAQEDLWSRQRNNGQHNG
jgi:hypothetical protein